MTPEKSVTASSFPKFSVMGRSSTEYRQGSRRSGRILRNAVAVPASAGIWAGEEMNTMDNSVKQYVYANERILWTGKGDASWRRVVMAPGAGSVFISAVLFIFAVFWEGSAAAIALQGEAVGVLFVLFGTPLVGISAYFCIGAPIRRRRQRKRRVYVLTDQRLLILCGRNAVSRFYRTLPYLEKRVRNDGSGTIWFAGEPGGKARHFFAWMTLWQHMEESAGFVDIDDAETGWRIAEEQRRKAGDYEKHI